MTNPADVTPCWRGASARRLVAERQWWDELGGRDLPHVLRTRRRGRCRFAHHPQDGRVLHRRRAHLGSHPNRGAPGVLPATPALPRPRLVRLDRQRLQPGGIQPGRLLGRRVACGRRHEVGRRRGRRGHRHTRQWMQSPRAGYHTGWQEPSTFDQQSTIKYESNWTYERIVYLYEQNVTAYEQSTFTYQQLTADVRGAETWDEESHSNPWQRRIWGSGSVGLGQHEPSQLRLERPGRRTVPVPDQPERVGGEVQGRLRRRWSQHEPTKPTDGGGQSAGRMDLEDARPVQRQQHHERRLRRRAYRRLGLADHHPGCVQRREHDERQHRRLPPYTTGPVDGHRLAAYTAGNTTSDATDGFRSLTWTPITQAAYNAGNTTPTAPTSSRAGIVRRTGRQHHAGQHRRFRRTHRQVDIPKRYTPTTRRGQLDGFRRAPEAGRRSRRLSTTPTT